MAHCLRFAVTINADIKPCGGSAAAAAAADAETNQHSKLSCERIVVNLEDSVLTVQQILHILTVSTATL